jgi:putative effector of murein hydrolase LrgA (UPF0299 family)
VRASPSLWKLTLATHLAVSVGWIGALAAYISLDVVASVGRDAEALRSSYLAMDRIVRHIIVPLALTSLLTGIVISLVTTWGLVRHYWVVISLILTAGATVVLLVEAEVVRDLSEVATHPATSPEELRALGGTLVHSIAGMVVLLVILVLNVLKPQGMTRYGRRTQGGRWSRPSIGRPHDDAGSRARRSRP